MDDSRHQDVRKELPMGSECGTCSWASAALAQVKFLTSPLTLSFFRLFILLMIQALLHVADSRLSIEFYGCNRPPKNSPLSTLFRA